MNIITDIFLWIEKAFKWWVIVLPWERGLRVRLGKTVTLLTEGTYLKLPVIDSVFVQTTRIRFVAMPIQTVTTKDEKTITITASIGYSIKDIHKLYNSLYSPDATIANIVMGVISEYVASHTISDCLPSKIEEASTNVLSANDYGLGDVSVKVIGYAAVRTYRLIQDQSWFPADNNRL